MLNPLPSLSLKWQDMQFYRRRQWLCFSGWFTAISTLLFYLVALRYLPYISVEQLHSKIYLATAYIGHFALFPVIVWTMLLPLFALLPYRLFIVPVLLVTLSIGLDWLLIDTIVYSQYRFHVSAFIWHLLTGPGAAEMFAPSWFTLMILAILFAATLLTACAALVIAAICERTQRLYGKGKYLTVAWTLSLLCSQSMHLWYEAHYDPGVTGITRHFPLYYPVTAMRLLVAHGWLDPDLERTRMQPEAKAVIEDLDYPKLPMDCFSSRPAMVSNNSALEVPIPRANLLIVAIDTMRADMLNADTTPFMHGLTTQSNALSFTQHFSGGSVTQAGIFSLFYGLPATYWNAFEAARRGPVLVKELISAGYRTGIFSSTTLLSPAFDRTVFSDIPHLRLGSTGDSPSARDMDAIADFETFIDEQNEDHSWFGFLFLDSAHSYDVPIGYEKFTPQWERVDHIVLDDNFEPTPFLNRYRNALYFIDAQLRLLFERLKKRGELANTIVIITSDHGEEFNDLGQNYWGHGSNFSRFQTQVPMLIIWPGHARETFTHRTSHYDLAPTLLSNLLGCRNNPTDYTVGRQLLDDEVPWDWLLIHSYFNYAIVQSGRQYVMYPVGPSQMLDDNARSLPGQNLSAETSRSVLEALSRFYK